MKTWHYILIGLVVIVGYVLLTKKSTIITGYKEKKDTSGLGGTLVGAGAALEGAAELWGAIFKSDSEAEPDETDA